MNVLYRIAENIGEFSHLDFLEEKRLVNGLIMANKYVTGFAKRGLIRAIINI